MSQQGGLFWSRPPRGLGGASVVGGRSHGEERRKASLCFLRLAVRGPYVVRTYVTSNISNADSKIFVVIRTHIHVPVSIHH